MLRKVARYFIYQMRRNMVRQVIHARQMRVLDNRLPKRARAA